MQPPWDLQASAPLSLSRAVVLALPCESQGGCASSRADLIMASISVGALVSLLSIPSWSTKSHQKGSRALGPILGPQTHKVQPKCWFSNVTTFCAIFWTSQALGQCFGVPDGFACCVGSSCCCTILRKHLPVLDAYLSRISKQKRVKLPCRAKTNIFFATTTVIFGRSRAAGPVPETLPCLAFEPPT